MTVTLPTQKTAHEVLYDEKKLERFDYHTTREKLTRYLRDRRLNRSIVDLRKTFGSALFEWKVLSVCGGVGGEGIFLRNAGFVDVTVSDFSENALKIARRLDQNLKTLQLDAEAMNLPDQSFDIVVVQDGLHHLPRPALGFTEMLRVARMAVIVIEPYEGLVGRMIGTEWEMTEGVENYVYRWNRKMVEQTVRSYLLRDFKKISVTRLWDHAGILYRIASKLPESLRTWVAKGIYFLLTPFNFAGNNMVATVYKNG